MLDLACRKTVAFCILKWQLKGMLIMTEEMVIHQEIDCPYDNDALEKIKKLLLFRKIVHASGNILKLDNGVILEIEPNRGTCSGCNSGDYEITELNGCDNAITNVELACEEIEDLDSDYDKSYKIFVYAENQRIKILQVDGTDGNGHYGTGYSIVVKGVETAAVEQERHEYSEDIVRQVMEELGYDEEEADEDADKDDFEIDEDGELLSYSGCEEYVTIPEGVSWIGERAFSGANVKTVTISEGVRGIDRYAFSECMELTTVSLPDSLRYIDVCAFNECRNLSSIAVPDSVEVINNAAFAKCDALADEDGWIIFRDICFDNVSGASALRIPNNVRIISGGAFENSSELKTVFIPENVEEVRSWSFGYCKNLESAVFLNDVVEIKDRAFVDCEKLIIYAHQGSTAEQYALEKGMRFAPIFGHTKEKAHGKIIDFQSYVNKRDLDAGKITLDELSLEELDSVEELYTKEINQIIREIERKAANIESLRAENEYLRKLLGKSKEEND